MDGRHVKLSSHSIRTAEDLEEKMDELLALNDSERFILLISILTQVLPRRNISYAEKIEMKGRSAARQTMCRDHQRKNERSFDDVERQRSVVIAGLPEPAADVRGQDRMKFEWSNIWELFEELNVNTSPVSLFRLGIANGSKPRLLKVVFPTSTYQQALLRCARKLRNSVKFANVFIRPSLTREERNIGYALRQQRKHLVETRGGKYRVDRNSLFDLNTKTRIPLDDTFYPVTQRGVHEGTNSPSQKTAQDLVFESRCASPSSAIDVGQGSRNNVQFLISPASFVSTDNVQFLISPASFVSTGSSNFLTDFQFGAREDEEVWNACFTARKCSNSENKKQFEKEWLRINEDMGSTLQGESYFLSSLVI
ncbi:hypothetical protein Y032_1071g3534 [Ancylostoma ceylanicum]|nr:hypothetical protein Y032_1071g3534 [Ancylostoma ceylanicum]